MTISASSYGTSAGVAALVPRHALASGDFGTTTRPTLAQVESFIDEVSALINTLLASEGFTTIPMTNTTVVKVLDHFVNQEVAALVEGVNGSGRFGPDRKRGGTSRWAILDEEVRDFIGKNATGFERLGETRPRTPMAGLSFRGTDESGADINPIFQRKGFGNSFKNWDS